MKIPTYKPIDPKALYSATHPTYHTSLSDFETALKRRKKKLKPAPKIKPVTASGRQPKRKAVIRFAKMRAWEKELIKWVFLILLAKWLIFGF